MSLRQAKKLKKQQEKQQLQEIQKENEEDEEIIDIKPQKKQVFNMMDMNDDEDEQQEEEEDEQEEKEQQLQQNQEKQTEDQKQKKQEDDKKNKKKKKKQKKSKKEKEKEEDLEQILEELNIKPQKAKDNEEQKNQDDDEEEKYDQSQFVEQLGQATINSSIEMFQGKLNYQRELEKYFKNAKLFEEAKKQELDQLPVKDKRLAKMLQQRKPNLTKNFKLVYTLKTGYPMPEKFQCQCIGTNKYKQRVFSFIPTKQYELLQKQYEGMKNTFDPQNIFDFIQQYPYHVDGLYDIGEFFRLQGNFKEANRLLEQILFYYEDCFSPDFRQIFNDISNQYCLSFDHNIFTKTFFLTLLKFTDMLGKKGCYRAALEYSKFLLKLNPYEDPVGGLLYLDYNALSSKQYDYLFYFIKNFGHEFYKNKKYSILYLPNFIYSLALAKFFKEKFPVKLQNTKQAQPKEKDIGELIDFSIEDFNKAIDFNRNHLLDDHKTLILVAVLLYPCLIKDISEKNEFHKQAKVSHSKLQNNQKKDIKDIFAHSFFAEKDLQNKNNSYFYYPFLQLQNDKDLDGLLKICQIYIERSKIVYKNQQVILWLKAAVGFILNRIDDEENPFDYGNFIEQVVSTEVSQNIVPFELSRYKDLNKSYFSDHQEQLDLQNIQDNVPQQFLQQQQQGGQQFQPVNTNQNPMQQFFSSLLPWVTLPNNQQQQQQNEPLYEDEEVVIANDFDDDQEWEDDDEEDNQQE